MNEGTRRNLKFLLLGLLFAGLGVGLVATILGGGDAEPGGAQAVVTTGPDVSDAADATGSTVSSTDPPSATSSTATSSTTSAASTTTTATTTTTTPTTTTTSTTTTTLPADQQGPSITFLQSTQTDLWENANYGGCPTQPHTAVLSAYLFDPSGLGAYRSEWSVGTASGQLQLTEGAPGWYSATIGPFAESTLSGQNQSIFVSLSVSDVYSNWSTAVFTETVPVTLHDCQI